MKKLQCVKKQFILKCGWQLLWFFTSKPSQNWKLQGNFLHFKLKLFGRFEDPHLPIFLYSTAWFLLKRNGLRLWESNLKHLMRTKTVCSLKKAIKLGRSIVFTRSFSLGIFFWKCVVQAVGNCRGILSPRNSLGVVLESMWACACAERLQTGSKNSLHCFPKSKVPLAVTTCTKVPSHWLWFLLPSKILFNFARLLVSSANHYCIPSFLR